LSQKSSVAGTEKLPVSDTEFITPSQITEGKQDAIPIVPSEVDIVGNFDLDWKSGYAYKWETGNSGTSSSNSISQAYLPIPQGVTKLKILVNGVTGATNANGGCFYNSSKQYLSGIEPVYSQAVAAAVEKAVDVPSGAAYARFTIYTSRVSDFYVRAVQDGDGGKALIVDGLGNIKPESIEINGNNYTLQGAFDELSSNIGDIETLLAAL